MKKWIAVMLIAVLAVSLFACAGNQTKPVASEDASGKNPVNLKDMYTVYDPEGVEYDQCTVLYAEITEEYDETMYAAGIRHNFCVIYGKDNQGVFMYEVSAFETEEQASAYAKKNDGKQDGAFVVTESDASYFSMMSAFLPDLQAYIDMMVSMGMTKLD